MTKREQFEAWAIKNNFAFRDEQGFWGLGESVGVMWRILQAARATPADHSVPVANENDQIEHNGVPIMQIWFECNRDVFTFYDRIAAQSDEAQSVRDAERYRYLTSRVVMTDASTPGITVITFVDDAIDEPNQFLDEIVDAGLKSAPPQKPVSDEVKHG